MSPDEAPEGTLCSVGHPANGIVARRMRDGWMYLSTMQMVDLDDERMLRLLWSPEED